MKRAFLLLVIVAAAALPLGNALGGDDARPVIEGDPTHIKGPLEFAEPAAEVVDVSRNSREVSRPQEVQIPLGFCGLAYHQVEGTINLWWTIPTQEPITLTRHQDNGQAIVLGTNLPPEAPYVDSDPFTGTATYTLTFGNNSLDCGTFTFGSSFCWYQLSGNSITWAWYGIGSPQNPVDIDVFYVTEQGGHHMPELPAGMSHAGLGVGGSAIPAGFFTHEFDVNNPSDAPFFASSLIDASIWTGGYDIKCAAGIP